LRLQKIRNQTKKHSIDGTWNGRCAGNRTRFESRQVELTVSDLGLATMKAYMGITEAVATVKMVLGWRKARTNPVKVTSKRI
jgi:uncharacterized protein YhdP